LNNKVNSLDQALDGDKQNDVIDGTDEKAEFLLSEIEKFKELGEQDNELMQLLNKYELETRDIEKDRQNVPFLQYA
jgi:hypothetical protein